MRQIKILAFILVLVSCGKNPKLEGIDSEKWKQDRNACLGYRSQVSTAVQNELPELKGLSEMDIVNLLGRPDQNEIYKRNQKFYSYFLSPGPACSKPDSSAQRLVIRFNAMGYAQLVSLE